MLQLQLQLRYTTLHPAIVGEVTEQATTATIATTPQKTQLQPPFSPSVDSLCPDSQQPTSPIGFLFLKLLPLPCAVLLVWIIWSRFWWAVFYVSWCLMNINQSFWFIWFWFTFTLRRNGKSALEKSLWEIRTNFIGPPGCACWAKHRLPGHGVPHSSLEAKFSEVQQNSATKTFFLKRSQFRPVSSWFPDFPR